jgi:hypothetical protein
MFVDSKVIIGQKGVLAVLFKYVNYFFDIVNIVLRYLSANMYVYDIQAIHC